MASSFGRRMAALAEKGALPFASMELTWRCNATCDYCYVDSKACLEMDTATVALALKKLADNGILFITFTGGEPFLRSDIVDILRHSIDAGFWYLAAMTNGTTIDEKTMRFIVNNRDYMHGWQVSIFSHRADVHDGYTGVPGGLTRALSTIRRLIDAGIGTTAAVNILDINAPDIEATFDFLRNLGIPYRYSLARLYNPSSKQSLTRLRSSSTREFFQGVGKYLDNSVQPEAGSSSHGGAFRLKPCLGLSSGIHVAPDGTLSPCPSFRNFGGPSLLDEGNLSELVAANHLWRRLLSLSRGDLITCGSCEHVADCRICVGNAWNSSKQLTGAVEHTCLMHRMIHELH